MRIPLTWYSSTTESYLPDESPPQIRKTYTSPTEISSKRHFCGFCGTPLAYWTESPPEEADFISLTLGSLSSDDLRNLEDLGVLPTEALDDAVGEREIIDRHAGAANSQEHEGLPWFQTLIDGSKLGNMKRTMGQRRSRDGRVQVEWEIVEWTEGDDATEALQPTGKRKLGDLVAEDEKMEGTQ